MIVEVDPGDPTPVYEQIRAQLARMIATGLLASGAQLPTIRQLAADLGLAKGTVAKAYEALLADGLVEAAGRRGTVVADRAPTSRHRSEAAAADLARAARAYAIVVHQLGVDRTAAITMLDRELATFDRPGGH